MIMYRPVAGERYKDRRLTQWRWERPEFYKKIWRPYHLWLDYAWPKSGDKIPVYSCTDWFAYVWYDEDWFGNYIKIKHKGYTVYYAHLDSVSVKDWQAVNAMQQIGIMGTTGNSSGVHLHLGLKWPGGSKKELWRLNPTSYITSRPAIPVITPQPTTVSTIWELLKQDKIRNGELWEGISERLILLLEKLYAKSKNQ